MITAVCANCYYAECHYAKCCHDHCCLFLVLLCWVSLCQVLHCIVLLSITLYAHCCHAGCHIFNLLCTLPLSKVFSWWLLFIPTTVMPSVTFCCYAEYHIFIVMHSVVMLCHIFKLLCTLPLFKVSLCLVSFMQSVVFAECHILLLCYHIFYCNAQCRTTYCVSQFFNCHAHCRYSKCRCD